MRWALIDPRRTPQRVCHVESDADGSAPFPVAPPLEWVSFDESVVGDVVPDLWAYDGADFIPPNPPKQLPDVNLFRRDLLSAFDGSTETEKFNRMMAVREAHPGVTEPFVSAIQNSLGSTSKAVIQHAWAKAKAQVGTANEIITATERDAIKALADKHLIPLE